jgi:hypothetical protein
MEVRMVSTLTVLRLVTHHLSFISFRPLSFALPCFCPTSSNSKPHTNYSASPHLRLASTTSPKTPPKPSAVPTASPAPTAARTPAPRRSRTAASPRTAQPRFCTATRLQPPWAPRRLKPSENTERGRFACTWRREHESSCSDYRGQ